MRADPELIEAVLGGDPAAYGELVRRYERAVRAAALEVLHDSHAAQDVAQEAFVAAYRQLGRLRRAEAFGGWVLRIARHAALRVAKRRKRHVVMEAAADVVAPPSRNGQLDEEQQRLLAAVVRLPEHERVVVMLRYFDGHAVEAIAGMTGRPVGTVTKQLSRAHARLREWLKDVAS